MKKNEMELLLKLLPRYYDHVARYPNTLLIKFFGLHRVTTASGGKVRAPALPSRCSRHTWWHTPALPRV